MNPAFQITRTNTILYCDRWADTVAFYSDTLGLARTHAIDWFVEVALGDSAHLSLADAARTSIAPGHGAGITLSWQVPNVTAVRLTLVERGVAVSETALRWNANYVEFHDPEGTRIELWSPTQ